MRIFKGTILEVHGTWGSGIGHIHIDDVESGSLVIACENAPTIRALEACFGNVVGPGHTIRNDDAAGHIGKEVYYSLDDAGLIFESFTPVEDATPEIIEAYESEREVKT